MFFDLAMAFEVSLPCEDQCNSSSCSLHSVSVIYPIEFLIYAAMIWKKLFYTASSKKNQNQLHLKKKSKLTACLYMYIQDKGDITDLKRGRSLGEYESGGRDKVPRMDSTDQFSGEEDMSD